MKFTKLNIIECLAGGKLEIFNPTKYIYISKHYDKLITLPVSNYIIGITHSLVNKKYVNLNRYTSLSYHMDICNFLI